jgi:formylglycine-generating enzyme required for sulfatase activity
MENSIDYKSDVFISYGRKDYKDEVTKEPIPGNVISVIKKSFDENGITYWIDEEGISLGNHFASVIAERIRESMIFLFVCSRNFVASKWVDRELGVADEFDKHIIPFICDDSYKDAKVVMYTASLDRIEFFGNFNPDKEMKKLVKTIKKYKEELEEKRKKEEETLRQKQKEEEERKKREEQARKKKETIKEIRHLATDYRVHSLQQEAIVQQLHEMNLSIGIQTKECPVCKNISPIDSIFCEKCGFLFPPLYAIDGNARYPFDKRHLAVAKKNYDAITLVKNEKDNLEKKVGELEKQKIGLETELERVKLQFVSDSVRQDLIIPVKGLSIVMKPVVGGSFWMGAQKADPSGQNYDSEAWGDEERVHKVTLSSFYMSEVVVTQALWKAVMGTTVGQQRDKANPEWPMGGEGGEYPMYYVNWNECQEFIKKLNVVTGKSFRLPTEAEWEYAARGGKKSLGYKYSGSNTIGDVAWYWENSGDKILFGPWNSDTIEKNNCKTHPVNCKKPNELGLYDMSGNVWEWCKDWYEEKYYSQGPQDNPQGPSMGSRRVLRGGSWSNYARPCRVSSRYGSDPDSRYNYIGFRLVLPQ